MHGLAEWVEGYREAWEHRDGGAFAALFTDDAVYRAHPTREAYRGRDAIRDYSNASTATQDNIKVTVRREPLVVGHHAVVEWVATLEHEGEETTLLGCMILDFMPDTGLCRELREYYFVEGGRTSPAEAWT